MRRVLKRFILAALAIVLLAGGYFGYRSLDRGPVAATAGAAPQEHVHPAPAPEGGDAAAVQHAPVQISPAQQQLLGVATAPAEYKVLAKTIRTTGRVDVDERRTAHVHAKISGWVEEVFVDFTFQHVQQGDPLFTIYSPELVSAQEELLLALRARESLAASPFPNVSAGAKSLLEAARRRLSLWDVSAGEIAELERTGQVKQTVTVYSPIAGHVTERTVYPKTYITPETDLYTIVDHSRVWIYADIYEAEMGLVQLGQRAVATSEAYPGQTFRGVVSNIWPHLEHETRTLKIRIDFPNPELKLKPEMYASVELGIPLGRRLVAPDSAVLDTGDRQLVFVAQGPGNYSPRDVRLGVRAEGVTEILSGLRAGEQVVTSAGFLIDSESQLRAALGGATLGLGATEIAGRGAAAAPTAAPGAGLQIELQTEPSPPRAGNNNLTVTVKDSTGQPVTDAQVQVVFYMPAMPSMGMAAMRSEAALGASGAGVYRGTIAVQSAGSWQVSVSVERAGSVVGSRQWTLMAR